jgi:hypothetical protein
MSQISWVQFVAICVLYVENVFTVVMCKWLDMGFGLIIGLVNAYNS